MSCTREHEVLQLETEWLAAADAASIRAHVAECASCTKTVELVLGSRTMLRTKQVVALTAGERRDLLRAITGDPRTSRTARAKPRAVMRWSLAFALASAAVFAFFAFSRAPHIPAAPAEALRDDLLLRGQPVVLPAESRLRLVGATVLSNSTSVIELDVDRDVLRVDDGELSIALADRDTITVLTPAMRLDAFGASIRLDVEAARTSVIVERGTVVLEDGSVLAEGESKTIGPSIEPAIEKHEEPPQPPPRKKIVVEEKAEPSVVVEEPREPSKPDLSARIASADAARRAGRLREAIAIYADVANDPLGAAFAEEAMLRHATLLENLGDRSEARALLDDAGRRFPNGELAPERVLLAVKIDLALHEPGRAATSLEQLDDRGTKQILEARIDVARALAESDPTRALALLRPALADDALRRSAIALEAEIRGREKK